MKKRGFTLFEVTLVLAITCMLFIAFLASTAGSLASRRYNDSVQNFTEFLRTQYAQVINVQSNGTGKTRDAIYGRVIFFGQGGEMDGTINSYDIIGYAASSSELTSASDIFDGTGTIGGNILAKDATNMCYAVNQTTHKISNEAWIEQPQEDPITHKKTLYGTLFIVRSPYSGAVTTKFINRLPPTNPLTYVNTDCNLSLTSNMLSTLYRAATAQEVNFCVASDDQAQDAPRRNIRVAAAGNSTSAVQLIAQDSYYNAATNPEGNKCAD